MVLIAAAEPAGDPALVWRAAARLGLARDAVTSAGAEGLLKIGRHVVFRHPLVRSAVYGASSPGDRRRVHVVLAAETDPERDPDRGAWHLAQAVTGPDEGVAAELERSAARAQGRGGLAAAAAFLDRAVQLSLDPEPQGFARALAAAQAKYLAGAPEAARRLLSTAEAGPLGNFERSQVDMIRAQIAYSQNRGSDAPALLLRAARRLVPLDLRMARATYLDAVLAGHFAGRLAPASLGEAAQAAQAARAAGDVTRAADPASASDLLLDGLAIAYTGGYAAGVPTLKQAVRAFRGPAATPDEQLRWLWPAAHVAMALWDDESYDVLSARHIEIAREAGVLAVLPTALTTRVVSCAFAGELTAAEQLIEEMRALTDAMGIPAPAYGPVFVSAWRGREEAAAAVIDRGRPGVHVERRGRGTGLRRLRSRGPVQRPRSLPGRAHRGHRDRRLRGRGRHHLHPGARRACRGGGARRSGRAGRGSPGAPGGDDPCQRYRLGSGRPSSLAGAAQHGRRGPRPSTARRSSGSAGRASAPSWRAPTWCTASGCAGKTAVWTPAGSCCGPSRCSPTWVWRHFPNARAASSRPPERRSEGMPWSGCTISRTRRRRSPGSPAKG